MGTAWACSRTYPWEQGLYVGGIETVKVNLALRIYSNAWHVYAGLAILNPQARAQIDQYAQSCTELFKLMLEGGSGEPPSGQEQDRTKKLRERIQWCKSIVFDQPRGNPILLSADILDRFSMGTAPAPAEVRRNSHLCILAMVDCWAHLDIKPFHHLNLAATPLFRLFLGVAEHLFLSPTLLESAIQSAVYDTWHRSDDLEFVVAARGWSQCVEHGIFEVYRKRFDSTRGFFESRFKEAGVLGSEMIKTVMESEVKETQAA
jgi:prephenate dehydrogenase (NADP+)